MKYFILIIFCFFSRVSVFAQVKQVQEIRGIRSVSPTICAKRNMEREFLRLSEQISDSFWLINRCINNPYRLSISNIVPVLSMIRGGLPSEFEYNQEIQHKKIPFPLMKYQINQDRLF